MNSHGFVGRIADAEDFARRNLVTVYKAIGWRRRDQDDIEQLAMRHRDSIDIDQILSLVADLAQVLEEPCRVEDVRRLIRGIPEDEDPVGG